MGVAIHLARCAAGDGQPRHTGQPGPAGGVGAVAWIGRRCWPNPRALVSGSGGGADHALLARSLFVDPPDRASRLWAIDLALRSSAIAAVVADGSGFDMASTRRLQLAARDAAGREGAGRAGGVGGGFCLLLRPAADRKALSAAQTRWLVRPALAEGVGGEGGRSARWMIELLRRKGPASAASSGSAQARQPLRFIVEWDHEAGAVIVAPHVVGGRLASKLQRAG